MSIMSKRILMFVAFAALVCANDVEDSEQKKRGAGKGSSLNSIPTGAQKPEYTYQVYSQNPSSQGSSYQSQVSNSFYPSQASSQYYSAPNQQEVSHGYTSQPQINLIPPQNPSQFVPINFVPNPGYQSKYQIIPSKTANGNIQLLIQPSANYQYQSSPFLQYPQSLFSPNPANQISQHGQLQLPSQQQFNVASPYQQLLGHPYLGQQSTMFLLAPPNPYNNLLYPGANPSQSFYNYYPSNAQQKYNLAYGSSSQPSVEYEKVQGPVAQSLPKEDNDIGSHGSDYVPSDSSTSYKTAYETSRSGTYSKLK